MSEREYSRRFQLANWEQQQKLAPLVQWLCDTEMLSGKVTVIVKPDGSVEHTVEYPPEVQSAIDQMKTLIKQVQAAILAHHLPGCVAQEETEA